MVTARSGAYAARETVVFLGLANGTRFTMQSGPLQLLVELLIFTTNALSPFRYLVPKVVWLQG